MSVTLDERYGTPGPIEPSSDFVSACRKGYYDYLLSGDEAQAWKRVPPRLAWAYETGAMSARTGQGLAKALHTLTLPHSPGSSYSRHDGLKAPFTRF